HAEVDAVLLRALHLGDEIVHVLGGCGHLVVGEIGEHFFDRDPGRKIRERRARYAKQWRRHLSPVVLGQKPGDTVIRPRGDDTKRHTRAARENTTRSRDGGSKHSPRAGPMPARRLVGTTDPTSVHYRTSVLLESSARRHDFCIRATGRGWTSCASLQPSTQPRRRPAETTSGADVSTSSDSFGAKGSLQVGDNSYEIFRLSAVPGTEKLPYSLKV